MFVCWLGKFTKPAKKEGGPSYVGPNIHKSADLPLGGDLIEELRTLSLLVSVRTELGGIQDQAML